MLDQIQSNTDSHSIAFYDFHPQFASMMDEVSNGLNRTPKQISPKFFYDARGSQLFDKICELDEYYPTRTEMSLLQNYHSQIADFAGAHSTLIELGSGSSSKIRILLDALRPVAYLPIDISKDHLIDASQKLAVDFPWLEVHATCIDYSRAWKMPFQAGQGSRVAFFPGSSIGNFEPVEAIELLKQIHTLVGVGGKMIIGVDRVKELSILEAAYNDSLGITADFNLNILAHLNRELGSNFNLKNYQHHAFFDESKHRIEMHLISLNEQTVNIGNNTFHFLKDEKLHTENSYKYTKEDFTSLSAKAQFETIDVYSDPNEYFSIYFLNAI